MKKQTKSDKTQKPQKKLSISIRRLEKLETTNARPAPGGYG